MRADMERGRWLVRLADGREVLVRAERLETWAVLRLMLDNLDM